jgi:hypothetical protein
MNKDRRKALAGAVELVGKIEADIEEAKSLIETARDEEQDYFDNMPEAFQQGDKGEAAQNAISELDEAVSQLEAAIDHVNNSL